MAKKKKKSSEFQCLYASQANPPAAVPPHNPVQPAATSPLLPMMWNWFKSTSDSAKVLMVIVLGSGYVYTNPESIAGLVSRILKPAIEELGGRVTANNGRIDSVSQTVRANRELAERGLKEVIADIATTNEGIEGNRKAIAGITTAVDGISTLVKGNSDAIDNYATLIQDNRTAIAAVDKLNDRVFQIVNAISREDDKGNTILAFRGNMQQSKSGQVDFHAFARSRLKITNPSGREKSLWINGVRWRVDAARDSYAPVPLGAVDVREDGSAPVRFRNSDWDHDEKGYFVSYTMSTL